MKEPASSKRIFIPTREDVQSPPEVEITKINPSPISGNDHLIASASNEPTLIAAGKDQAVPENDLVLSHNKHYRFINGNSFPDTIKKIKTPKKAAVNGSFAKIKFKNGTEEIVKIIYHSGDTLRYKLVSEKGVTRTVMMKQVDTILPDPRKTEKLGLAGFILSILGLIPFIGIPFAIMAYIFGVKSLRKIKKDPKKYKGKGYARASQIIGGIEILCYIILAIVGIVASIISFATAVKVCTGG